jgi:hypothetical protein
VLDAETQSPLAGAAVLVGRDSVPFSTDSCGRALYPGLANERKRVAVSLLGHLGDFAYPRRDGDTLRISVPLYVDMPRAVRGRASDAVTEGPLQGVAVLATPSGRMVTTDSAGRFLLDSVPPGEVTLAFSLAAHHQTSRALKVTGGDTAYVDIVMYDIRLHGRLIGRVTDAKSGDALPGASVVIRGTEFGAATDANGGYTVMNLVPGVCEAEASYMGYQDVRKRVFVRHDKPTRLDFELSRMPRPDLPDRGGGR